MFNPLDWYWSVAGRVWSSRQVAYVQGGDPSFAAWIAGGGQPVALGSEADLYDVLARCGVPTGGTVGTVAQRAADLVAVSVVSLASAATPALNGFYHVTPDSTNNMLALQTALNAGIVPGGGTTFPYPDASGADHQFTPAQFTDFAGAVMDYVFVLKRTALGKGTTLPAASLTIP